MIAEIVKNAVADALTDVHKKLDAINARVDEFPTEIGMRQAAAESIDYSLQEIQDVVRNMELNAGRAELRLARAAGRVS